MRNPINIVVRIGVFSLGILMLSLGSRPVSAQVSAGLAEISGIVRDATGGAVPNAEVVVSNNLRGVHITLNTSDGGVFNAPSLIPATGYTVTVNKSGFSTYEVKDIALAVGQNLNLEVSLSVASATQQVVVEGTAPLVDDTKSSTSQVIGSQQILDLPINGRRVDTFVLLTPSVTNDGNFGLLTFNGVANGNTFLLDGNDSTDQFWVENNGRTRILSQISQDVVQEFQVVSANYSAEYGRADGGVINTVTRSGTNDFHGTAYTFYRNQNMIARDPFSTLSYVPDQWRLQSGASLDGPIVKDKLFFFMNGEFARINFPLQDSISSSNVTIDQVNHVFLPYSSTNAFGCNSTVVMANLLIATPAQCSAINALLPRFFGVIPRTVAQDLGFARLDYHLSDHNTLSASFNYMWFATPNGLQNTIAVSTTGQGVNANGNDYARTRNGKVTWTGIIGTNMVNEFRYGYNTDLEGDNVNAALNGGLGNLALSAAGVTLGSINYLPRIEPNETRHEFGDDFSWTKGRHIVKFGVDIATTKDFSLFAFNLNGNYSYSNLTAFALDYSGTSTASCSPRCYSSYSQAFGNAALNTRINDFDFYVEDQWRATDKLTVTLGMRYEYEQLPTPPACNTAFPLTCQLNSSPKNLMPRVGLAYRLNSKTVIRAAYGIFYARIAGAMLQDLFTTGNGIAVPSILLTGANIATYGPVFPHVLSAVPAGGATTVGLQYTAPNWSTPYEEQGNFGVEREITRNLSVTASYIWSRGIHLNSVIDQNLPTTTTPATYTIDDASGAPVGTYTTQVLLGALKGGVATTGIRPNTTIGALLEDGNGVTSFYNALAIQVSKRFSHGFMGGLAYTWSHEIDDGQGFGQSGNTFYGSSPNQWLLNGNFLADKGNGLEDQPQRLVINWVWTPTIVHRDGAFYKYAVNNWELSSITTINSSRPYGSPTVSISGTPVPGMFSTFTLNGIGFSSRVPFLPVASVWQPARYQADMRLSKIFPINERYKVAFNLEVFNISNSWSPTTMNLGAFTESTVAGVPTLKPTTNAFRAGTGSNDAAPPDGTEARRLQVSARFTF